MEGVDTVFGGTGQQRVVPDAELLAAVREKNDEGSLAELYRRHRPAVLSYARSCCRDSHTAEDLVSEAFARTLQAVRSGGGPEVAWRPYLLTTIRRIAVGWGAVGQRVQLSDDFERWLGEAGASFDTVESSEDWMLRAEDNSLVLRAFRSLPERWQVVLWHAVVEGEPAAEIGALLGLSTSGVASLTARAKEGLREAFLTAHVEAGAQSEECRYYRSALGAAVRRAPRRPGRDLQRHLASCVRCHAALVAAEEVNNGLGRLLSAGVLLWGGAAYMAVRLAAPGAMRGAVTAATSQYGRDLNGKTKTAVAASVVAAAGLLAVSLMPGGSAPGDQVGAAPAVSEPSIALLSPSPSPSPHNPSPRSPEQVRSSHRPPLPSPSGSVRRPTVSPTAGASSPAKSRNVFHVADSTMCMDGYSQDGGTLAEPCDNSPGQKWDVLDTGARDSLGSRLVQLRNVASSLCLASVNGSDMAKPVNQSTCDADDSRQVWAISTDEGASFFYTSYGPQQWLGYACWDGASDEGQPFATYADEGSGCAHMSFVLR
ncbi:sigma-70 family RNA polymerase sigma factor [Streptomyces mauvecolor]